MAIRWIQDGEPHVAEVYNRPLRDFLRDEVGALVPNTRKIVVSNGVRGGGTLDNDIEIKGIDATTVNVGVSRFATIEEVAAGVANNIAVTPHTMKQSMPAGGIGENQKWFNVTSQRSTGATYTNDTGKPIMIFVRTYGRVANCSLYVDGILVWHIVDGDGDGSIACGTTIVPAGSTYRQAGHSRTYWSELRDSI